MGIKCKIHDNYVEAPNGERSQLFDSALEYTRGDFQKALDIYTVSQTEDFRDYFRFKVGNYKSNVKTALSTIESPEAFSIGGIEIPASDITATPNRVGIDETEMSYTYETPQGEIMDLGFIRLKEYPDGYQVTFSNVNEAYEDAKGQGLGTFMYKNLAQFFINNNENFYSDFSMTPPAQALWNKMKNVGAARQTQIRNNDGNLREVFQVPSTFTQVDSNGEPTLSEVLKHIGGESRENKELSFAQVQDIKNALIDKPNLRQQITTAFLEDGVFVINRNKLLNSGIYSLPEVNQIMTNIPLQNELKSTVSSLISSEQEIGKENSTTEPYYIEKNPNQTTSLGMYKNENPYILEKNIVNALGGIQDRSRFEGILRDSEFESLKEEYFGSQEFADEFFQEMGNLSRLREFKVENGELTRKTQSEYKRHLEETLLTDVNNGLNEDILYLEELSNDIWENNPQEVSDILTSIREKAVDYGVDLSEIESYYGERTQEEILDLLTAFKNLNLQPNPTRLDEFANQYEDFYELSKRGAVQIETVPVQHRDKTLIYLDSEVSEYELFDNHNLLKVDGNIYQRVDKIDDIETLYDLMANAVISNPNTLPREAYKSQLDRDGSINRNKLNNPDNYNSIRRDIREFSQNMVASLNIPSLNTKNSELQKMVLYKFYFNNEITFEESVNENTALQKYYNFEGNSEYLSIDFVTEFNKEYIKNKQRGTEEFNSFYNHFQIDEKGITIKNNDPISMAQIEDYLSENSSIDSNIKENLKQYSIVSKNMNLNNALETNTEFVKTTDFYRDYYTNNPMAAPKAQGEYTIIDETTIATKANPDFIRTSRGVYEAVEDAAGVTFYKQLPPANPYYNQYNVERPELGLDPNDYKGLQSQSEREAEVRNKYTKQELETINQERFECE